MIEGKYYWEKFLSPRVLPTYVLLGLGISTIGFGIGAASLFLEPRDPRPSELQIIYAMATRFHQPGGKAEQLAKLYGHHDEKLFRNPSWIRGQIQESAEKMIQDEVWRERTKVQSIAKWFIWSGILISAIFFGISKLKMFSVGN